VLVKPKPLKIDPQLTEALLEDAAGQDALPLLAFALRYLYDQYRANDELIVESYEKLGRLRGIIQNTVKQAIADGLSKNELPKDDKVQLILIRMAFIPHLARVNAAGHFIRRIAVRGEIPPEARPLIDCLTEARLLIKDRRTIGGEDVEVIEVAHEALLREWKELNAALLEESEFLIAKGRLEQDVAEWKSTAKAQKDGALLKGNKLARAGEWVINRPQDFTIDERDFIEQSVQRERRARASARLVQIISYVLLVAIIFGLLGWIKQSYIEEQVHWWTVMRPYMRAQVRPYVLGVDAEATLKPGDGFKECAKYCPEMAIVPAGEFIMGSPESEQGSSSSEGPQHKAVFTRPFAVARFEVTFDDWDACVAYGDCPRVSDSGYRSRQPVINVTWDDARHYVAWLSRMTGKFYRLLSEAEFEYAARARTLKAYPWGNEIGKNNANCADCGSQWDNVEPSPVGSFKANEFGLYDMHGNVWQWLEDCYHRDYEGTPQDGSAWIEGGDCSRHIVRGGSWGDSSRDLRSASRGWNATGLRTTHQGFRAARTGAFALTTSRQQ
jgi:formylglycine-generating enzyme required for sulfatase activity